MVYEELHQRYGGHIAGRLKEELGSAEFSQMGLAQLADFLENRAEDARRAYQQQLGKPLTDFLASGALNGAQMDALYRRWREAVDLAYLINVTEDAGLNVNKKA